MPASAEKKYCTGCHTDHPRGAFLVSVFTPDQLTDSCLVAIRQTAERDRLARERQLQELEAKRSPAMMKTCRACKTAKSLDEFTRHRLPRDGRRHDCRSCVTQGRAKKRPQPREEQKRADRARREEPHRRIANEIAVQAWRDRSPQASTPRLTLSREVRSGHIMPAATRQALGCNSSDHLQGHHNHYRKARRWSGSARSTIAKSITVAPCGSNILLAREGRARQRQ